MKESSFHVDDRVFDDSKRQSCLFCGRKDKDMAVYSAGLGRLGICFECAERAVEALTEHSQNQEVA